MDSYIIRTLSLEGELPYGEKTRNLKVCYRNRVKHGSRVFDYTEVPTITLSGKWLEQCGFSIGDKVLVECEDGNLLIIKNPEE